MSHSGQPAYGRPFNTFSGGPPGGYGGGYTGSSNPNQYYQQGQSDAPYPPSNGPQPFYFIPPSQHGQGNQQTIQPKPENVSSEDLYSAPPRTNTAARPASIAFDPRVSAAPHGAGPQELATSSFDSPITSNYGQPPPQNHAGSPPPQQQQQPQAPYDPYTVATGSPPSSSYGQAPPQTQAQQKPQGAIYTLPSQSQQRIPAQPSDPYSWSAQQQVQTAPPNSTSPVQQHHQQQTGYPPAQLSTSTNATTTGQAQQIGYQSQPGYPPGAAYAGYQAYQPDAPQRWSTAQQGGVREQAPA
jgi:hypothetical protein